MTYVELQFPFTGKTLPSDHGYSLYGAISRVIPEAHSADWLAVETIPGMARGNGVTQLDQEARLKIRIPQEHVPLMLKLLSTHCGNTVAMNVSYCMVTSVALLAYHEYVGKIGSMIVALYLS